MFNFAPHAYLVTDAVGVIQHANLVAAKLLNIEPRFLVGKPLYIFLTEKERQTFHEQLLRMQQVKYEREWEVSLQSRHCKPFNAALMLAKVCDQEAKVVGLRICVRKIERELAEVGLEENNPKLSFNRPRHIYLKGEIIPLQSQIIWQVCQGIVKLSTLCEDDRQVFVGLAGPLVSFGLDLTLLPTYQARALSEVHLVCFSASDIAALTFPAKCE